VASVLRHPLAFDVDAETEELRRQIASEYDFGEHMSVSGGHGVELPERTLHDFAIAGSAEDVTARLCDTMRLPVDEVALVLMGKDKLAQARAVQDALARALNLVGSTA
jgi:hypothetical protein